MPHDPDMAIVARTDAGAIFGMDEAIERGQRYAEAGADIIFVEAPRTVDEMRKINNRSTSHAWPTWWRVARRRSCPAAELEEIGYRVAIFANFLTRTIARTAANALQVSEARRLDAGARGSDGGLDEPQRDHRAEGYACSSGKIQRGVPYEAPSPPGRGAGEGTE